jgi:hypothetical protein
MEILVYGNKLKLENEIYIIIEKLINSKIIDWFKLSFQ